MSCTLTERTLEIRKGWLFRIESTIPLDKITDLQLYQGPLMRAFGLQGFRVETAGHSAGPGRSLVNLVGIVDTPGFRQAVLDQRDALAQPLGQAGGAGQAGAAAPATPAGTLQAVDVLADIRASLHRIERLLEHRKDI
ncbi:MAG: hypothetical protein KatS3mg103_1239 [Phycisphaerales bacterium]|nr:MAG: hypothetical protein KatS3mg103_1239 [Phycisphaerales bacterium]